jgi:hypothetical protein
MTSPASRDLHSTFLHLLEMNGIDPRQAARPRTREQVRFTKSQAVQWHRRKSDNQHRGMTQ